MECSFNTPFNTRSIPHYRLSSSVAQLCLQSRCHFVTPRWTHSQWNAKHLADASRALVWSLWFGQFHIHKRPRHPHTPHTHRHTHTHKCQLRSIGHVGCLFRKCPPFNTPRYPPVQYLPFNTLLNRRLPHIHRGPGVLTHTHICI